jgi:hypothetical protein
MDGRGTPTRISVVDGVGNWPSRQRLEHVVEEAVSDRLGFIRAIDL